MPNLRGRWVIALIAFLAFGLVGCVPTVEQNAEADLDLGKVPKSKPPTRDGEPAAVDDEGNELPVHYVRGIYEFEKPPGFSVDDVSVTGARVNLLEPEDIDLSVVREIEVFLLPRDSTWKSDISEWYLAAVSSGFVEGQRYADFDVSPLPDKLEEFIRDADNGKQQVYFAILITVQKGEEFPDEGIKVRVSIDMKAGG